MPRSRYVLFGLLAVVGCAIDLLSKHWVFDWLGMPFQSPSHWLIPDIFGFTTSLNEGALAGVGFGKPFLFAGLSVVAGLGIVYWLFVRGAAADWLLTFSLGLVMAGILGNLYDRLGLHGLKWTVHFRPHEEGSPVYAVRDFLHFQVGAFQWPIFNIADSMLVVGATLLVWHAFRPIPAAGPGPQDPPSEQRNPAG